MTNLYSRVDLTTYDASAPAPLPENLIGLSDESLSDLDAALDPNPEEFDGVGFWPAVEADILAPELDHEGARYLIPRAVTPVDLETNINQAPSDLFGGPTLEAIYNGN